MAPLYVPSPAQLTYRVHPAAAPAGMAPEAAIVSSSGDIQTLAQTATTLATSFAVNEALSPAAGALSDVSLTNMVARELRSKGATVLVPSAYSPYTFTDPGLGGTVIGARLIALEANRANLQTVIQSYAKSSADATVDSQDSHGPDYQSALSFTKGSATNVVAQLTSLASQIDSFETSLFTGQGGSQPNQQTSGQSNAQANPTSPLVGNGNASSNNAGGTGQQQPTSTSGSLLAQILPTDLLMTRVWGGLLPSAPQLAALRIVTVHALESGGGQLTKTNLFTGTKVYFGGGSVATYQVFQSDGGIRCAGYVYGYRGYVREKTFEADLGGPELPAYSNGDACAGLP
jgi:hypothetical protein